MPFAKDGREYSYLECCACEKKFDGDPVPEKCPFCGAPKSRFGYILVKSGDRTLTYKEDMDENRAYLKAHLPTGVTAEEVDMMSDRDVESLCDIMAECSYLDFDEEELEEPCSLSVGLLVV